MTAHRHAERTGKLLVAVRGLSGTQYPVGTVVAISGSGSSVDAFVGGDWLPLRWWEFSDAGVEDASAPTPA
jgi:hypothetical protein